MQPILVHDAYVPLRPAKRAFDATVALAGLLLSAPLSVVAICVALIAGRDGLTRRGRIGREGRHFHELSFTLGRGRLSALLRSLGVHRLPRLLNVLLGDMSIVGPRALDPDEVVHSGPAGARWTCRPGLLSLWSLRRRANMAFDDEETVDEEYALRAGLLADLGILCRALPYMVFGEVADCGSEENVEILGLTVHNPTMDGAVDAVVEAATSETPRRILFVNAHCVNVAYRDERYRAILHRADRLYADGIGMRIAGKVLGGPVRENVNGTDLFPRLLARCEEEGLSVYFLGARPGVAEKVARWAKATYPRLILSGHHHGYLDQESLPRVKAEIRALSPDLLFVAMGVPAQEKWLDEHLADTGARAGIAVGGLFDFFSGSIPRAPMWMRELGLEWAFRLWQEPGRMWRRYVVGNLVFLWHVLAARCLGGARL